MTAELMVFNADNPRAVSVKLLIDQKGDRVVMFEQDGKRAYIPEDRIAGAAQPTGAMIRELLNHGITVPLNQSRPALLREVSTLTASSGTVLLASVPGWVTPTTYVFGDGTAYARGEIQPAVAVQFPRNPKFGVFGSLDAWREGVAPLLLNQPLLKSVLCFAFMPLLLPYANLANVGENFGLQLTGPTSRGKTTALRLLGSVWGGRDGVLGFWETWRVTSNGLETLMHDHNDSLLLLDEANLAGETRRARGQFQATAVMMLSSGRDKTRHETPVSTAARLVTLSTSNEPLSTVGSDRESVDPALRVRMPTLDLSDRPYGILDHPGLEGASAIIQAINTTVQGNFGHPSREFVRQVTAMLPGKERELKRTIRDRLQRFKKAAKFSELSAADQRICNAFALAYVAGHLAMKFGILPSTWGELGYDMVDTFLQASGDTTRRQQRAISRFEATLASCRNSLVSLPLPGPPRRIPKAVGYLKVSRNSEMELLIRPPEFAKHFGSIPNLLTALRETGALVCDSADAAHQTTKRALRGGVRPERFRVIRMKMATPEDKVAVLTPGSTRSATVPQEVTGSPSRAKQGPATPSVNAVRQPGPRSPTRRPS